MVVSTSNLVEIFTVRGETRDTLSMSVGETGSRSMVDIQYIECKNQQETYSNRRNIVCYNEIMVKLSNSGVKIFTGNS